jgi:hypothetical protein
LGGNAVKKSTLSQQVKTQLQPFADKVKVQEEGYSVAFTMDNRIYESTAVFHSEAQAKDYLQRQNAADPKLGDQLHVISNFEVNHS